MSGLLAASASGPGEVLTEDGAVLVNPASADGATRRRWPRIRAILEARGLRFSTYETDRPGSAGEVAARAAHAGAAWIICVGGDGTFNEAVNGLADATGRVSPRLALGFIPSGTGLDLLRNLELPREAGAAAARLGRSIRRIDLGRITWDDGRQRLFVSYCGAGLDGEVAQRAVIWRRFLSGKLPYAVGLVTTASGYRARMVELVVEPRPADGSGTTRMAAKMLVASNGPSFGGGMRLMPAARMDDGLLDLFILGDVSPLQLLTWLPSVYRGTHLQHPETQHLRIAQVRVVASSATRLQTDGEPVGLLPATLDVVSDALTVLT